MTYHVCLDPELKTFTSVLTQPEKLLRYQSLPSEYHSEEQFCDLSQQSAVASFLPIKDNLGIVMSLLWFFEMCSFRRYSRCQQIIYL